MRFNAHLLQSNGGVADLGAGQSSYADMLKPSGATSWNSYYTETVAKLPSTNTFDLFATETRYRRAYVDQIYCAKPNGSGGYNYATFFSGDIVNVAQHEVMTAGQMSDYITNATQGIIPKWIGDHRKESDSLWTLWTSNTSVSKATWTSYNLTNKIYEIFYRLFYNDGITPLKGDNSLRGRFDIYAGTITATSVTGALTASDANVQNLLAGRDTSSDSLTHIFKVTGGSGVADLKRIEVVRSVNTNYPSGIFATQVSGSYADYTADGATGFNSFVDFGRYYLRDTAERHVIPTVGKTYIRGSSSGAQIVYNGLTRTVTIPYPSDAASNVLIDRPRNDIVVGLSNGATPLEMYFKTSSDDSGVNIIRGGGGFSGWSFSVNSSNHLKLSSTNGDAGSKFINLSILLLKRTPVYATDYHIMTNQCAETMHCDSTIGDTTTLFDFVHKTAARTAKLRFKYTDANNINFIISQYNGSTREVMVPSIGGSDCDFLITRPTTAQNIYNRLNIAYDGTSSLSILSSSLGTILAQQTGKTIEINSNAWAALTSAGNVVIRAYPTCKQTLVGASDYRQYDKYDTQNTPNPAAGSGGTYTFYKTREWKIDGQVTGLTGASNTVIAPAAYFDNLITDPSIVHVKICVGKKLGDRSHMYRGTHATNDTNYVMVAATEAHHGARWYSPSPIDADINSYHRFYFEHPLVSPGVYGPGILRMVPTYGTVGSDIIYFNIVVRQMVATL